MRILFSVRNPWYVRHYDSVLRHLAADGHHIDLVADGLGRAAIWPASVAALVEAWPSIRLHWTPAPAGQPWYELGTRLRQSLYFLRFFQSAYHGMPALLRRAEEKAPRWAVRLARTPLLPPAVRLSLVAAILRRLERAVPPSHDIAAFLGTLAPDVVVLTPLIVLRTVQLDLLRSARAVGIPTVFGVASWDHLSSKGVLWTVPDRVVVWNAIQRAEAIRLHDVPEDRVQVTGAQLFDDWFAEPSHRTHEEFCGAVGLDPRRPYVLWVCSALFEGSPIEAAFVARWVEAVRSSGSPLLREAGILIRPHPRRADEWKTVDLSGFDNVVLHPADGASPVDDETRRDYYDALRHAGAVVGLNTSAMVEAAILRRPVLSILLPGFRPNQEGTVHFRYLMDDADGVLECSRSLEAHVRQLDEVLRRDAGAPSPRSDRFVAQFIRPLGRTVTATPLVASAVTDAAATHPAPQRVSVVDRLLRPLMYPFALGAARGARSRMAARHAEKAARRAGKAARRREASGRPPRPVGPAA